MKRKSRSRKNPAVPGAAAGRTYHKRKRGKATTTIAAAAAAPDAGASAMRTALPTLLCNRKQQTPTLAILRRNRAIRRTITPMTVAAANAAAAAAAVEAKAGRRFRG